MAYSPYSWEFTEAYLGKNSDTSSYESQNTLFFKQLNNNSPLNVDNFNGNLNYGGYQINNYDDIAFVDLNNEHAPDSSFTIEFSVTELDAIDTTQAINYLTFGYHVRGKSGVTVTVGRDVDSGNVVLGTITETSTAKGAVYYPEFVVEPNTKYNYTLSYNNFATDEEKLKLFRGPYLISSSSNLEINNFSIVDRKLFLGSSAWTNEPSWNDSFDVAKKIVFNNSINFYTNKVIDKEFLPNSPFYPVHYSFENMTNADRNTHQIAVNNDTVQVKFHSTKDVPVNNVYMNIDGLSNNITQVNVQNPFLLSNGSNTVLYTYEFQVTDSWPSDGILSYGLDMYGNITLSNIFPPIENNMYIDNTIPTMSFNFFPPTGNNVSFAITDLEDTYLDVMTNQTPFEFYKVTFYASNNEHVKSTIVDNPVLNQTYFVENLNSETVYNLYATVTDRAGNVTNRILPSNGSAIVETLDITTPVINNLVVSTITQVDKTPGVNVSVATYDTASALTVNEHNYTVYIGVYDYRLNAETINVEVSVQFINGGNKFVFTPSITQFVKGNTYIFNNPSWQSHPLKIVNASNANIVPSSGGQVAQTLTFYVDDTTSTPLYIECNLHANMGSEINGTGGVPVIEQQNTLTVVENTLNTHNHFQQVKTNASSENITQDIYTMFDTNNNSKNIITEKQFFVYCLAIDNAGNKSFSQTSHIINNTMLFEQIATNFTPNDIATLNNTVTMYFSSEYKLYNKEQFQITMMGDTVTNAVSSNGVNWVVSNVVKSTNNSGAVSFRVAQTPDLENQSSFDQTAHFDTLYIQKENPVFKTGVNTSLSSGLTSVSVTNIGNYIDDFTINSNNNLFKLEVKTNGEIQGGVYNSKAELPATYQFNGLKENSNYEVRASISNLFTQSTDLLIGSILTLTDVPTITLITTSDKITDTFYPLVQLSSASKVTENTTQFNLHVYVTDFDISDPTAVRTFLQATTPQVTNNPTGSDIDVTTLISQNITTFLSGTSSSYTEKTIVPTTGTYYLYGLIDDNASQPVYAKQTLTFDYTYSGAVLTNTSYDYFVRNGDVVTMTWTTTYVSQPSDFTNVKIFGTAVTPISSDGLNWTAQVTVASGANDHSVSYLGTALSVDATNVFYDNSAPSFTINIISSSINSFVAQLSSLGADTYTNQSVPAGITNTYSVVFTATNTSDNTQVVKSFTNITYANLTINTFTIDGLENGGVYTLSATLTDPANNTSTILYNGGNSIETTDTVFPVISNTDTTVTHVSTQTFVTASNIKAYDEHSSFDIYAGVFSANDINFDIQTLKDNSNTSAVIYQQNIASTTTFVALDGVLSKTLIHGATTIVSNFEYNRNYYLYVGVEDANGNINSNNGAVFKTFSIGSGPQVSTSNYDPNTGTFVDANQPIEPTTDETAIVADTSYIFQPVADSDPNVDNTTSTTTYAAYDTSGNNNHIYFSSVDAATNPLSTNAIVNDYSVDLGATTGITLSENVSITNPENEGFTYTTYVNNTNDVFDETVLLQNGDNNFLTISESGVTVNTNTSVFFPVEIAPEEWNSVTVSVEGNTVKVFVNGQELLPTIETANNFDPVYATGQLTIPAQENVLIDAITIYNIPVNDTLAEVISNQSDFKISLDFENPPIVEYNVIYDENKFYLNNIESPQLVFNSNYDYTFLQASSNAIPLILSETGTFPVPDTDNLNVSYYINDVNIGNDPLKYSLEFATNDNNKVVLHTDSTSNLFYHSTNELSPTKITVKQQPFTGIRNKAITSDDAQPVYTMMPAFSTNTVVGEYALVFDATKQTSLEFHNFTIDANNMTLSTWVNTDFSTQSNNPLVSQQGVFEFGIDKTGKSYFKLFNNDTPANYATIETLTMSESKINISNMAFNTTNIPNPAYVYALVTTTKRSKEAVMAMMDANKNTDSVYFYTRTTETSLPSIDLTKVYDTTNTVYNINAVNQAYVYVSIRENSNNYVLGVANQYEEYLVSYLNTVPRVLINNTEITEVDGVQTSRITDGSLFTSASVIDKYYSFVFLQNEEGMVGDVEITDTLISNFVNSTYFTTNFNSLVTNKVVYEDNTDVPKNIVKTITNASVTQAFDDISNLDSSTYSNINPDLYYVTVLISVDINNNKKIVYTIPYAITYYNNKSIFHEQDLITPETMTSYTNFAIKHGFLFTYSTTSIKVFRMDTNELVSVHTSTTPSTITSVLSMIDLPHVVYTYNSGGYTQFRILTVDVDNNTIIENTDTLLTSGLTLTSFMLNDKYFIGRTSTTVGVYAFDKTSMSYMFMESFTDFTYNGTSYSVSNYTLATSKFITKNNMFAMMYSTDKGVVMFKYNGVTWNNVYSRFVLYDTNGVNQYIAPGKVVYSNDGNYVFVGGYSTSRKGHNTGMFYVYRWNGTEYVNAGFIAEKDTVYNHFAVDMSVTMDNRLLVLDYATMSSTSGQGLPENSNMYGYTFDKNGFDFNSSTLVYYGNTSSNYTTRVFNFFTDFYSTVFMKQNESPRILYFREMYNATQIRPYPPRGWINGAHVTGFTPTMNIVESGGVITLVNTGHPTTTKSTWTLPESYVNYGAGQYVATTNKNYNNSGHFPAGAFTKLNQTAPAFHTATIKPSEVDPVIFTISLPTNIIIKRYDIHARHYSTGYPESIASWKLQASNDNFVTEIIDLDTQTSQIILSGKFKSYNIINSTAFYKAYRLRITENQNNASTYSTIISEFELWGIDESSLYPPIITLDKFSNIEVNAVQSLQIEDASVKSLNTTIDKHYAFAFVQNVDGTVGASSTEITDSVLSTFINSTSFTTNFDTNVASGAIYSDETDLSLDDVKTITNATVTKAFNSLSDATSLVPIDANSDYIMNLVAIDGLSRITHVTYIPVIDVSYLKSMDAHFYATPVANSSTYGVQYNTLISVKSEVNELYELQRANNWNTYSTHNPITYYDKVFVENRGSGINFDPNNNISHLFATQLSTPFEGYDASSRNANLFISIGKILQNGANYLIVTPSYYGVSQKCVMLDIVYNTSTNELKYAMNSSGYANQYFVTSSVIDYDNTTPFIVNVELENNTTIRIYHNNIKVMEYTWTTTSHIFWNYDYAGSGGTGPSTNMLLFNSGGSTEGGQGGGMYAYLGDIIGFTRVLTEQERTDIYNRMKI